MKCHKWKYQFIVYIKIWAMLFGVNIAHKTKPWSIIQNINPVDSIMEAVSVDVNTSQIVINPTKAPDNE